MSQTALQLYLPIYAIPQRFRHMVIGQVQHIFVEKEYAQGYEQRYGTDGFMMLIPAPQDLVTGQPNQSAIATVKIERLD